MGIVTILWEKWREFLRDFSKITLAALIAPLMYLIVFGWGIRTTMNGQPYLYYLIPGVVSLTTMNGSFSAIAQNLMSSACMKKRLIRSLFPRHRCGSLLSGRFLPVRCAVCTLRALFCC